MGLADSYAEFGRHAEALKLRDETLALRKVKLGPDHPDTLWSMHLVANSYAALGRYADALKLFEETLAMHRAKLGPDHPGTLFSMSDLACCYACLDRHSESLRLNEETLALRRAKLGPDHRDTLTSMANLALNYHALGRHAESLRLNEETLALRRATHGPDHPNTLWSMSNLADSYAANGRHADALKLREQTLGLQKVKLGPDHPHTLSSMNSLAWLLAMCPDPKLRDAGRAVELARKAVELAPTEGRYWTTLGVAHYRAGDRAAAIVALRKSEALRKGGDIYDWFFLAMSHWQRGEKEEARKWYDRAGGWVDQNKPNDDELRRVREEAAELLKVEDQPKPVPKSK